MAEKYDVIIVGGGVAGAHLASKLNGNVLVLEKDRKVRLKDSGIVSSRMFSLVNVDHLVKEEIREMEAVSPSGKTFLLSSNKPFAYILKRKKFSHFLRKRARKKARIKYETVQDVVILDEGAYVKTNKSSYRADVVVGADGANSVVRRSMGIKDPKISVGFMLKARKRQAGMIRVFVNKYYSPDYFAWHIPVNREYGLISSIRPKSYMDYFTEHEDLPKGKMYAYSIPMGMTKSFAKRAILVGDACGQNKPLTGGGIVFGTLCAGIAADNINTALRRSDFSCDMMKYYDTEWRTELAREIRKQMLFRKMYRKFTNRDIDKFFENFGPHIEQSSSFDYDRLSTLADNIPKLKLLGFFLRHATKLF